MKKSWGKISKKFGEKIRGKNAKFRENPVKNIKIREISRKIEKKFEEKSWKNSNEIFWVIFKHSVLPGAKD